MIVKLLTEQHLEFLSLKRGCRGSSESTLVKMLHCWKSHGTAQYYALETEEIRKRIFNYPLLFGGLSYYGRIIF